jgi:AraC-like DNA-binding protein
MDALSEMLNAVHMTGAIFINAEFSEPWGVSVPSAQAIAATMAPGTEQLVNYHLITEGQASARMDGEPELTLESGDVLILPHGDPHSLFCGTPPAFISSGEALERYFAGDLVRLTLGGSGLRTRVVCGFFGCDRHAARLFLAGLPRMMKLSVRGDAAGEWLENSIRYLASEAGSARAGRTVLLSKMAEALFIETLRRYMEQLTPEQTGWLAAARDPVVGLALSLLHRSPRRHWTLDNLAAAAGTSRSVLSERFTRYLGEPPLTYLTRWRLQLAAQLLKTTRRSIMQLADDVGYESEAAFNRAFKREFGAPPAQYRKRLAEVPAVV